MTSTCTCSLCHKAHIAIESLRTIHCSMVMTVAGVRKQLTQVQNLQLNDTEAASMYTAADLRGWLIRPCLSNQVCLWVLVPFNEESYVRYWDTY